MNKETSPRVSAIAAHILAMEPVEVGALLSSNQYNSLLANAKTCAGSALSQDETASDKPHSFVDRLRIERDDLQVKRDYLHKFLRVGPLPAMNKHHWDLLESQLQAMSLYLTILNLRLADLTGQTTRVASDMPNTAPGVDPAEECTHELIFAMTDEIGRCTRCSKGGISTERYAQSAARAEGFLSRMADTHSDTSLLVLGEPQEVGGHDEDRDGPVKFDS